MNDIKNANEPSSSSGQASSSQTVNEDSDIQREHHRTLFKIWLVSDYPKVLVAQRAKKKAKKATENEENEGHSTSSIISLEKVKLIKDCLLSVHNDKIDSQFKHWVTTSRFNLIEKNNEMRLYRTVVTKTTKNKQVVLNKEENLPVAIRSCWNE